MGDYGFKGAGEFIETDFPNNVIDSIEKDKQNQDKIFGIQSHYEVNKKDIENDSFSELEYRECAETAYEEDQKIKKDNIKAGMVKLKEYWRCKTFVQTYRTQELHDALVKIVTGITKKKKVIEHTVEEIEKLCRRYND